jgi:hypothetical protein
MKREADKVSLNLYSFRVHKNASSSELSKSACNRELSGPFRIH